MKTKEYVTKFNVKKGNTQYFDNKGFMKAFIGEFNERLELTRQARLSSNMPFTFNLFQNLVKEMEDKFWAISNKRPSIGFTQGLWNTFYAMGVIPARKEYFPKEHAEIDARRKKHLEVNSDKNIDQIGAPLLD